MHGNDQQLFSDHDIEAILRTVSPERFGTYMVAAGHDRVRALRLYMWNAQVGESFHLPIQAVEVALRNGVNHGLTNVYGPEWWRNDTLKEAMDDERKGDISVVLRRIRNRKLPECNGQVVAGLSFGFWVGILDGRYNPPLWSGQLRPSFPFLPQGRARKTLFKRAGQIAFLRNRISHHEPLIHRDLGKEFSEVMEFLSWLCPTKTDWIWRHCRLPEVIRQKP